MRVIQREIIFPQQSPPLPEKPSAFGRRPPGRKLLRPGQYDWIVCSRCGARHGWRPEQCLRCGSTELHGPVEWTRDEGPSE